MFFRPCIILSLPLTQKMWRICSLLVLWLMTWYTMVWRYIHLVFCLCKIRYACINLSIMESSAYLADWWRKFENLQAWRPRTGLGNHWHFAWTGKAWGNPCHAILGLKHLTVCLCMWSALIALKGQIFSVFHFSGIGKSVLLNNYWKHGLQYFILRWVYSLHFESFNYVCEYWTLLVENFSQTTLYP